MIFPVIDSLAQKELVFAYFAFFIVLQWLFVAWLARKIAGKFGRVDS
jgi:hypothetical protein